MRRSTLLRFLIISIFATSVLGVISFHALRYLNESSTSELRKNLILFMAKTIESGPYRETVNDPRLKTGGRGANSNLWVFSPQGKPIASNVSIPPSVDWEDLKKPESIHDTTFHYRFLRIIPDFTLVKLESKDGAYLLIDQKRTSQSRSAFWMQGAFFLFVILITIVIATSLGLFYLRQKSNEARLVLSRLEKGDLKARFEIRRSDATGNLMLDFNRMASEIERLVRRIEETETARKNLLKELSHDLRTPLTSLRTSVETLSEHSEQMSKEERGEFITIIRTELAYFLNLIDDLFFIADLAEPRYKKSTRKIDALQLIRDELKSRQSIGSLEWKLIESAGANASYAVLGDPLLIQRLFKNALENASRHAKSQVVVKVSAQDREIEVSIEDNGPGISDQAIADFGKRRLNREYKENSPHSLSMGLGSVIMKTILDLHGGEMHIQRISASDAGTRLNLLIPRDM